MVEDAIACIHPDDENLSVWYRNYSRKQKTRLAFDVDYVRAYVDPGAGVLEFGSVPPILTAALSRLGFDVCGLDLMPERFQSAMDSEGLDIRKVDFEREELPMPDERYDVVIFNEVFEHLRIDPIFTLGEANRVLKLGGMLMLSTPNLTSWNGWYHFVVKGRLAPDMYIQYRKLTTVGHMGHVRIYSVGEVIAFLTRMGFEATHVIYRGRFRARTRWRRNAGNVVLRLFPRLRTSFSVVARKVSQSV